MLFFLETLAVALVAGLKFTALGLAIKWMARY
jgi:hypothetical protein